MHERNFNDLEALTLKDRFKAGVLSLLEHEKEHKHNYVASYKINGDNKTLTALLIREHFDKDLGLIIPDRYFVFIFKTVEIDGHEIDVREIYQCNGDPAVTYEPNIAGYKDEHGKDFRLTGDHGSGEQIYIKDFPEAVRRAFIEKSWRDMETTDEQKISSLIDIMEHKEERLTYIEAKRGHIHWPSALTKLHGKQHDKQGNLS